MRHTYERNDQAEKEEATSLEQEGGLKKAAQGEDIYASGKPRTTLVAK